MLIRRIHDDRDVDEYTVPQSHDTPESTLGIIECDAHFCSIPDVMTLLRDVVVRVRAYGDMMYIVTIAETVLTVVLLFAVPAMPPYELAEFYYSQVCADI